MLHEAWLSESRLYTALAEQESLDLDSRVGKGVHASDVLCPNQTDRGLCFAARVRAERQLPTDRSFRWGAAGTRPRPAVDSASSPGAARRDNLRPLLSAGCGRNE